LRRPVETVVSGEYNVKASRGCVVPFYDDYSIPAVGEKWQVGQLSAPELRAAVLDLMANKKPPSKVSVDDSY
jgi:hypothetical protein